MTTASVLLHCCEHEKKWNEISRNDPSLINCENTIRTGFMNDQTRDRHCSLRLTQELLTNIYMSSIHNFRDVANPNLSECSNDDNVVKTVTLSRNFPYFRSSRKSQIIILKPPRVGRNYLRESTKDLSP